MPMSGSRGIFGAAFYPSNRADMAGHRVCSGSNVRQNSRYDVDALLILHQPEISKEKAAKCESGQELSI